MIILLFIIFILLLILLKKASLTDTSILTLRLDAFKIAQESTERAIREEVTQSREELGKAMREQRQELSETFKTFSDSLVQRIIETANRQNGQLDSFSSQLILFSKTIGERLDGVRTESTSGAKQLREEVVMTLSSISETMTKTMKELAIAEKIQLEEFSRQIASLTKSISEKLDGMRIESSNGAKQLREEVITAHKAITESTTKTMNELAHIQKSSLEAMSLTIEKLSDRNEKKLEAIRSTVEGKLQNMQVDNAKQLDKMRQTVDEKLQGTLEKRLGESFKQVSERLEQVHKGLGEMQILASGVGDLKKVLTNIKTRGTWGEVQLGTLLEQVLSPDQFATNIATKDGSERVEFAIRLPGQGTSRNETVWLPIDAKFPVEDYLRLIEAQERNDVDATETEGKLLEKRIKICAKNIHEKYLHPPKTTDFGILFLPIEGLFAEVIRRTGLTEVIQREYRVVIAGPTTLWSILSSLQMGFRTLAIQKRSSEVWNLLAAVKTEWIKYGDILENVQKKLHQASETIEKAKVRSRAIGRKLKDVEELPTNEVEVILPPYLIEDDEDSS